MLEIENKYFEKFGIDKEKAEAFKILVLPENFEETDNKDDLFDATDAIQLAKRLKGQSVSCANSFDLDLKPKVLDRRGEELWFGLVYVLDQVVIPLLVAVLAGLMVEICKGEDKKVVYKNKTSKVHLKLKIKKASEFTTIKYDGDPKTLVKMLEGLNKVQE